MTEDAKLERAIRLEVQRKGPESPRELVKHVSAEQGNISRDSVRSAMWTMLATGELALDEDGRVAKA